MIDYLQFWFAKMLLDAAVPIVLLMLFLMVSGIVGLHRAIKQGRCKHLKVYETRACQAVCRNCGKNLGFIGTWRERNKS